LATLTGCTLQETDAAAPTAVESEVAAEATETPAFHFASGDLPLGEFDPYTIGDDLFDPCAEISDEEFAAAGFTKLRGGSVIRGAAGQKGCAFDTGAEQVSSGLASNAASAELITQKTPKIEGWYSDIIPGAFAVGGLAGSNICFFAVETTRGVVTAFTRSIKNNISQDELCARSRSTLEAFFAVDS